MEQRDRWLSSRAEFSIVVLGAFGYFIIGSVLSAFSTRAAPAITENGLQFLVMYEVVSLALVGGFLYLRGWTLQKLGFSPRLLDVGVGAILAAVAYVAFLLAWFIATRALVGLEQQADDLVAKNLSLATVVAVSVLNPFFEEVFVCGYIITALKKTRSVAFAVNVSLTIRLAYHLYQGAVGVVSIIPLGLIFSYWFAKTGRLWPVVVAHALFDLVGLLEYVRV